MTKAKLPETQSVDVEKEWRDQVYQALMEAADHIGALQADTLLLKARLNETIRAVQRLSEGHSLGTLGLPSPE